MEEKQKTEHTDKIESLERREFLKKAAKRSLTVAAVTVTATTLAYQKPGVKSFSGKQQAFAQATVTGKFSLKGTTETVN
jgi:hypothetical protein